MSTPGPSPPAEAAVLRPVDPFPSPPPPPDSPSDSSSPAAPSPLDEPSSSLSSSSLLPLEPSSLPPVASTSAAPTAAPPADDRDPATTAASESTPAVALTRDKKIILLRRPSSSTGHPRSPPVESTPAARATRAASEGRGGARSPALPDATSRRTGSDSSLPSASTSARPYDPAATTSDHTLASPADASLLHRAPDSPNARPGSAGARGNGEDREGQDDDLQALDQVLLLALSAPKDRVLLLRAEMEMERFLANPDMSRLPLSPPHFPAGLNSYQRLLIHHLADTFGITREAEPAHRLPGAPMLSGLPTSVLVLVKGPTTKLHVPPPALKLSAYIETLPPPPAVAPTSAPPSDAASPSTSVAPSPSSSTPNLTLLPAASTQPQIFKILPRASSHHATSSASSSTGADDDSARGSRGRTLEEREAAYKQARERIFKEKEDGEEQTGGSVVATPAGGPKSAGPEYSRVREAILVGTAITRPNSAGSTYSRSSTAFSGAGGSRPSPSTTYEPSEASTSGHQANFQGAGATVYYAQPPPQLQFPRMVPPHQAPAAATLRPSAPSFDPSGGGWTPSYYGNDYSQPPHGVDPYVYAYPVEQPYANPESDWARHEQQQRCLQGGPQPGQHPQHPVYDPRLGQPRPTSCSYPQQPPIQVTAPSPLPHHAPYAQSMPSHSPPHHFASVSPNSPYHHYGPPPPPPPGGWAIQRPPIPSPALSTSSAGSLSATDRNGGYLMRFPEGSVSPVGPGVYPNRSASSLSSASSTSTSRNASMSSLRDQVGTPIRRTTHSASHSLSSIASGGRSDGSSVRRSASTETSGSGGSKAGSGSEESRSGRERESTAGKKLKPLEDEENGTPRVPSNAAAGKRREVDPSTPVTESRKPLPLHPSLPVKPGWLTSLPSGGRAASVGSASSRKTSFGSEGRGGDGARRSFSSSSLPLAHSNSPPIPTHSPYSHVPHPNFQPPGGVPYYASNPGAFPIPQQSPYAGQLPPRQQQPAFYPPPPPSSSTPPLPWQQQLPPQPAPLQQDPYYNNHPQQPQPQPVYYHLPAAPHSHEQMPSFYAPPDTDATLLLGPELRRPPPRSTQLFNPNDPVPSAGGGGGMRRTGSSTGRGVRNLSGGGAMALVMVGGLEEGDSVGLVG